MEVKTFIRLKKVDPKQIAKEFTKENEEYEALNNYFYIKDYKLKKMNSCQKFNDGFKGQFQMLQLLLPGQTCDEDLIVKFNLEETSPGYVANRMELEKEIFYAVKPQIYSLRMINNYYDLIEHLAAHSKFFRI